MEPIFTLPYSEFMVVHELGKLLSKKQGYSAYLPFNRQQKGVDFLMQKGGKIATFQVKSSRIYENKNREYRFSFKFPNVMKNNPATKADFYCFIGMVPVCSCENYKAIINSKWLPVIFCLSKDETQDMSLKTKKEGKPESYFYVEFDDISKPVVTRGFKYKQPWHGHFLRNKVDSIEKFLT